MIRLLVLVLVLALGSSPIVAAQPHGRRGGDPQLAQDRRDVIKKRIRVLRATTLADELELDERALARLLPVLARYDDLTEALLRKRVELHQRLTGVGGVRDPRAVDQLVNEAIANQKAFWALEERRLAELRRILTPHQIARLLIVLPEFERKIQNRLRRAMVRSRGRAIELDSDDDDDDTPTPARRR